MRKAILLTLVAVCICSISFGQNTFPTSGKVGIGTTTPFKQLEIYNPSTTSTETSVFRLHDLTYAAQAGYYQSAWDLEADGTILNIRFKGQSTSNTNTVNLITTPVITINSGGGIQAGSFSDKNDARFFLNPAQTTISLKVAGKIIAPELEIMNVGADYVFAKDYHLMPLKELDDFIKEKNHLPNIKPAVETEKGVNIGEFSEQLLSKIEELTLYIIAQDKRLHELEALVTNK